MTLVTFGISGVFMIVDDDDFVSSPSVQHVRGFSCWTISALS